MHLMGCVADVCLARFDVTISLVYLIRGIIPSTEFFCLGVLISKYGLLVFMSAVPLVMLRNWKLGNKSSIQSTTFDIISKAQKNRLSTLILSYPYIIHPRYLQIPPPGHQVA